MNVISKCDLIGACGKGKTFKELKGDANMIKEVHKVVSDYTEWDDKYIVYYVSGCKKEYLGYNLPKSVERFIDDEDTEAMHVHPGGYTRFFRR